MNPLRILVADDDPQNQRMLALILRRKGYSLIFASTGLEVLEAVKTNSFDLILMDVLMPQMDGVDATRQIRAMENADHHLPIVGLTAVMEMEYRRCLLAGMDNVLSKPLDIEELEEIIIDVSKVNDLSYRRSDPKRTNHSVVLDIESAVHRLGGDQETYKEILGEFIHSLPIKFCELKDKFLSKEWDQLSDRAHNLKGLSASIGAMRLSRIAKELDQLVSESMLASVGQKINEIEIGMNEVHNTALAYLNEEASELGNPII